MPEWAVVVIVVGGLALVVGLVCAAWLSRLRSLTRRVGSFGCGLWTMLPVPGTGSRAVTHHGLGLRTAGIAHYGAGHLNWWRAFSLSPRPAQSWDRRQLEVLERQPLGDPSRPDLVLVHCRHGAETLDLTMSAGAVSGLVSWLEAAPPVARSRVV